MVWQSSIFGKETLKERKKDLGRINNNLLSFYEYVIM